MSNLKKNRSVWLLLGCATLLVLMVAPQYLDYSKPDELKNDLRTSRNTIKVVQATELSSADPTVSQGNPISKKPSVMELQLPVDAEGFKHIKAKPTKVISGDLLNAQLEDGTHVQIRLLGIDAPELRMPFGSQSKGALEALLNKVNNQVDIYFKKRDDQGRILGKLQAGKLDINLEQVRNGNAWVYRPFLDEVMDADRAKLKLAQQKARARNIGLWVQENPEEPWIWVKENPTK